MAFAVASHVDFLPSASDHKVSQFKLVPGAPYFHWSNANSNWDKHFLFSYSRHSMVEFLGFIKERNAYPALKILAPRYMCHEVITTLGEHAQDISYYEQAEDFSYDVGEIKALAYQHGCNILMVSHMYGKYCSKLKELSEFCEASNISLLEDSAHLPWFYLEKRPQYSDVQFFTYRKLFSIPYGASAVVRGALRPGFSQFVRNKVSKVYPPAVARATVKWFLREQTKRLIAKSGLGWKRHYVELGDDPLQPFNRLPGILESQLRHLDAHNFVQSRRDNFSRLNAFFKAELPAWEVLGFDLDNDVPYQFMFFKREQIDFKKIINQFLSYGISMVKGLELPRGTAIELGASHPFNNQLCLPIHQDVNRAQLDHMIHVCRQILVNSKA